MRVVHLLRKYDPAEWGGTESALQRLFYGLEQEGVTPVMYCPRLNGTRSNNSFVEAGSAGSRSQNGSNGNIKRFKACVPAWGISPNEKRQFIAVGGNLMSFDLLPALWRERDLSLVHTHTLGRLGGIASAVARGRGLPFVVSIHGGLLDVPAALKAKFEERSHSGFEWGKIFGLVLRSRNLIQHADAVFACNNTEAELLRRKHPGKRIEVQPHSVAAAAFHQDHRPAAREAFPAICGREVLLCAGRIDPVKNQEWLIRQAPELFRRHPRALFVFAGGCTDESYLQGLDRLIAEFGLQDQVLMTGGLPPGDARLIGLFQEARALLLPSISETFGLVVLEAWAAGSSVISSRTSGASALIRDGENGFLFELNDAPAFHRAVDRLLGETGLAQRLAETGRQAVQNDYDVVSAGRRVKRLYEELIEGKHALRHRT